MSNYAYLSARDTEPAAVRCVNGTRAHDLPPLAAASADRGRSGRAPDRNGRARSGGAVAHSTCPCRGAP